MRMMIMLLKKFINIDQKQKNLKNYYKLENTIFTQYYLVDVQCTQFFFHFEKDYMKKHLYKIRNVV